ncbi:MAG: amino acid adenylation domain-containing protein [Cyanobacteria bacterium P01_A01_bin.116]
MENVADIYPLTPLQSGMLFHTLTTQGKADQGDNSPSKGVYVNQFTCVLTGELHLQRFQQAWQTTIERHPVLRTAVLWEGLDEPLQVVRQTVPLPWQTLDWRGQQADEQTAQLSDFLQSDRTQGFDLAQAPLLRLTLIQLTDETFQFVLSNHHLLYDGWSLLLVWQDVLSHYAGSAPTHPSPRPFRDYVGWHAQQNFAASESFWRTQLQSATVPTPLPAARSTASQTTVTRPYQQQSQQLTAAFTQQLSDFARQHRLTLNTLVQGAWALLLSHYSDGNPQTERHTAAPTEHSTETMQSVTYGSVVSGRPTNLSGVESIVGLFINTLPVCVQIDPSQPLLPWLQARQKQLLSLREHEATPLSKIQKWSDMPQGSPLFESIVAFENLTAADTPSLDFEITNEQYLEQSNYPLALLVFPAGQENDKTLDLRLLYDVTRFESGAIAQLLTHLKQLLTAFIEHPQATLSDLPRLTQSEQQQLAHQPQSEYPQHRCIHQLIEEQAARSPNALAVTYAEKSLTYTELNQQANQLATVLRSRGVVPGKRVALCLNRSVEMIVGILAVLKAGGTYVPLDPNYPETRLDYCLNDTAPQLLITQHDVSWATTLSTRKETAKVPCLFLDDKSLGLQPTTNLNNTAQPQNLAYIIYTSGSTGMPKGVMVSHRNLMQSTTARFAVYAQPVERFLLLSSIAFDSSIAGIFWTLCQGGELVISPRRIEQDLQQLAGLIARRNITHTLCVPTLYGLLLDSLSLASNSARPQLASLKTVIVAGEACSRSLAQQHHDQLPTTELYNEYGPTEAAVWCTTYRIPALLPPGPISIGTAIPNAQVYLLNPSLQSVPLGAIGELYIGGDSITQGYLNQPEKTKEAFLEISASSLFSFDNNTPPQQQSRRLYRTGDLGRYRNDGTLEWLGRCDRQVKIRGYRIELGEIEEALRSQPGIREAVVIAPSSIQSSTQPPTDACAQPNISAPNISTDALIAALEVLPAEQADKLLTTVEEGH